MTAKETKETEEAQLAGTKRLRSEQSGSGKPASLISCDNDEELLQ